MNSNEGTLKTSFKPVFVYQRVGGPNSALMGRAFIAPAGSYLRVGEPTKMSYDHKDHLVTPLLNVSTNGDFFIMLSDAEEATVATEEKSSD